MKGNLYVVATPIGHLSDITIRAIDTLRSVGFILAEDTRETKKLLNKYDVKTQLVSYRDQNHQRMISKILEKLDLGVSLALVSDSGTPTISDPGYRLVSELKMSGYRVIPIPGPSAVIAALSVSGLPTDKFSFVGFLPKSDKRRVELLEAYGISDATLIIYESPNRLVKLLNEIVESLGHDRMVSIAHNLTKLSEEVTTDKAKKLVEIYESKETITGEYVVMIAKSDI